MGLHILIQSGSGAGRRQVFPDTVEMITLGRDPARCQVVFPADEVQVSREHCAFRRVLGRYRLVLNEDNLVKINGRRAYHDTLLERTVEVQLGPAGPVLSVETTGEFRGPVTSKQGRPVTGVHTRMHRLDRRARLTRRLVLLVVLGLAVAAPLAVLGIRELTRQVREQERSLEETREDLAAMQVEVTGISERQREQLEGFTAKLESLERESVPALRRILERARPSIYLVLIRDESGGEQPVGTAWVAGDQVLATNAHVAMISQQLEEGQTLLVRSNASPPVDHPVLGIEVHPGYEACPELLERYAPRLVEMGGATKGIEAALSSVGICDVALLRVAEEPPLARPLQVASARRLEALKVGDTVCQVGYPAEGLIFFNPRQPTPQTQIGNVTAMTTYLFADSASEQRLLVQCSTPGVGGASGSPILDTAGEVVALQNAGNYIHLGELVGVDARVPLAAGIYYSQRADLVTDLLEGRAEDRTELVVAHLRAGLERTFPSGRARPGEQLELLLARWQRMVPSGDPETVMRQEGELVAGEEGGEASDQVDLQVSEPGRYLVMAVSQQWGDLSLTVDGAGVAAAARDGPRWFCVTERCATEPGDLQVKVSGSEVGLGYLLQVLHAPVPDVPAKRDELLASWQQRLGEGFGGAELIHEEAGVLPPSDQEGRWEKWIPVSFDQGRSYLLVALAEYGHDIDLYAYRPGEEEAMGSDAEPDWCPVLRSGEVPEDGEFVVRVVGFQAEPAYRFLVYRAAERSQEDTLAEIVRTWGSADGVTPEQIHSFEGSLPPPDANGLHVMRLEAELPASGTYLFVVIPEDRLDFDMVLLDEEDNLLDRDTRSAWHASLSRRAEAGVARVLVAGPREGARFTLYVFGAAR